MADLPPGGWEVRRHINRGDDMAIRFRKTIKLAPGLKLNLGKKSASVRIGGKNMGYSVGTKGRTASASIPGTGLGVTSRSGGGKDLNWFPIIGIAGAIILAIFVIGMMITGSPKP